MKERFSKILNTIPSSGIREFFDIIAESKDIISLGVGEPDFTTPKNIRNKAIKDINNGQTKYSSNKGSTELRENIGHYLQTQFNYHYHHKTEILITNGGSEGIDIALRAILNPKDEVIIPEPNYVCYSPLTSLTGAIPITIDTTKTNFIPKAKDIESKISKSTKAIILCSPNNPTGAVIPKEELIKIGKLVKKHNLWVLSDEIYAELSFDAPFFSLANIPELKNNVIIISGFSKAFSMTGWRLGYICGPEALIEKALKIHQYSALCASTIAQSAALQALKELKEVKQMVDSYKKRRSLIIEGFNKINLPVQTPGGAFYCFPCIKKTNLSSETFALKLLKEQKVAVVPGTAFSPFGEGYIRCCYATNKETLKEAIKRIDIFLKNNH